MGKRMQLLVAPGCICLLLLLVPSGYSNFDRYWRMFDMRTATKLEHKHFCPHCATEADAAQYSIDRNTYCQRNGCLETGKNTVFVASLPSQQESIEKYGVVLSVDVSLSFYYNHFVG